jgi:hypothetical protein
MNTTDNLSLFPGTGRNQMSEMNSRVLAILRQIQVLPYWLSSFPAAKSMEKLLLLAG